MKTAAMEAIKTLTDAGFPTFVVGGAARDLAMGRNPKDYDLCTSARPEDVMRLFTKTIPVGVSFGVVVVVIDGVQIEIATFRTDGCYSDARRPDIVFYGDTLEGDLERRDFTMNGLALSVPPYLGSSSANHRMMGNDEVILDFVGGLADIDAKVIRCIGDPATRFTEDALRMMRAVRFAAQLGFDIEERTKSAIIHLARNINRVSRERVRDEMFKILTSDHASRGISLLFSTGLAQHIFAPYVSELNVLGILQRFERFHVLTPITALAMFLTGMNNDCGLEPILHSLKLSTEEFDEVYEGLDAASDILLTRPGVNMSVYKRLARRKGLQTALLLVEQDLALYPFEGQESTQSIVDMLRSFTVLELYPKPLITGDDLVSMGMQPSRVFSIVLKAVETRQLDGTFTTRAQALDYVRGGEWVETEEEKEQYLALHK